MAGYSGRGKLLENPPFSVFLTRFYQWFTNISGEPDLLLSRIHTMKSETERVCLIRLTKNVGMNVGLYRNIVVKMIYFNKN